MGKHSRDKGINFEQLIATAYRERWPGVTVRRSEQAHRPFEPDVVVDHHPFGSRLWTECQHADDPTPLRKLAQAERDIGAAMERQGAGPDLTAIAANHLYPIVVWRQSCSRVINMTTRMWVIERISGKNEHMEAWKDLVVTLHFQSWLAALGA